MIKDVIDLVDRGRKGESVYIPTRFPRFGRYFGVRRAVYTYLGGDSGTGKSAFAHQTFILDPIRWMLENPDTDVKLKIFAWLMERPIARTKAKWVCQKLWEDHNILVDTDFLLGEGSNKSNVPDHIYEKVRDTRDYFEKFEDYLEIHHKENPTGIWSRIKEHASANGKIITKTATDKKGNTRTWKEYEPSDPQLITIVMVDHIGITGDERGFTFKQKLDKMSEYGRDMRDKFGFSPIFVNQFNRNKSDSTRRTKMVIVPESSDFDGSSNPFKDCDVAIGILDPNKYNIKDHFGYKIQAMAGKRGSRFRATTIMKNTYGPDDIHTGMGFVGECGEFNEIVKLPKDMTEEDYKLIANPNARYRMPEQD